ncbi:ankyrin repeat domain-containing protein [Endozoicomonas sp. SCSIO W0465]|uniref:ankyrin repeat domain-containing protein n=1 Tax=Endozoicomonas sp. SCSIO W0465 TaxID=2918516 RepID=UPI00207551C2|nr:ankyrin repeat domain-containing protein [Endozoicomonas sp. SCSIO W0465]USE37306.1 ankyrin repeat domain-containing protein [Endozoicomonas sp. SCSIO W0465]
MCRSIAVPLVRESSSLFDDDKETNPFVELPVLRSVRQGQRDLIAQLLVSSPEMANRRFLSAISGEKVSLLCIAAQNGHRELAADLLAARAGVNVPCKTTGTTPLYIAAQNGHRALAADLLAAGAGVNAPCKDGTTPLYIAAQNGHRALLLTCWLPGPG